MAFKTHRKSEPGKAEEISLRIDGALISPEDFKRAVHAFVEILLTVTEDISRGGKKPLWNMSVRAGSTIFVAKAVPDVETRRAAREAIKRVRSEVGKIERGRFSTSRLPQRAFYAVKELASLQAKPNQIGINKIEIGNGDGKGLFITHRAADVLKKNLGAQSSAYGSIEGKLSTISERNTFQFVVYDALTDRGVNCFIEKDQFKDAHGAFGRRVCVSGTIHYDRDGRALSIKAEKIRVLRELSELPEIASFRGLLKSA